MTERAEHLRVGGHLCILLSEALQRGVVKLAVFRTEGRAGQKGALSGLDGALELGVGDAKAKGFALVGDQLLLHVGLPNLITHGCSLLVGEVADILRELDDLGVFVHQFVEVLNADILSVDLSHALVAFVLSVSE